MKKWFFILLAALLTLVGCSDKDDKQAADKLKKVSVVLDWTPNTNHTGLYVAKKLGYFEEQGLDVDIIMPGEAGADQLVASGKADFGVSYQEGITQARVQDVPLVSIAAIIQHNTSGFASIASKSITSPKDFEGKTYGGWGAPLEQAVLQSLMQKEKADINKLDIVNAGDLDFFTMMEKDIDFAWIYYAWTGIEAELRGEKINMLYLTDYSDQLDYYTPVLATNEKMIQDNPNVVKAFVAAASKGYEYAIENPSEAADILIEAAPDLDKALVHKSQEWLADKYQDDAKQWGEQKLSVWENYAKWMSSNQVLEGEFDAKKAFTNDFLPKKEAK
ncbi:MULTISPECIES: ABC transporter substrate-binding protein [Lysinibacillus]|uniref:ABC transporter substrate-binding protein n=1 Tax=Lysinibacillus TaxID=400634 RepID=UPI0021A5912C|nr:ABC transporter substrate-binding protein [Lysinibacillus capsici]MCT1538450.1 ABC transporter substrate-binding protein [Lysinibacillus capsici]MCT1569158.1 ABC transporter substrate-binding protein [Lysinibacillus capsici]MCT1646173.1 ABC transporter substrate-binding protein [Lysinibacillus capsici]MCT1725321.1 ABC transporter substrate-binding protein [Lysinibacillus capsici]MCT1784101.1 ABC transporter substrate-binding protein [Lysinibacillus capsici]